jgi:MoxR-like ATPase
MNEDQNIPNPKEEDENPDQAPTGPSVQEVESPGYSVPTQKSKIQELNASIKNELGKVIVGQHELMDLLTVALLVKGHILIEGVPGIAKTLTAKLFAKTIDASYSRMQFTPDLMPSDVIGTNVFNTKTSDFEFKKGPVFADIVVVDEINRSPAKTQSALFEVMQENQVTVDGNTTKMGEAFMVIATQNPLIMKGHINFQRPNWIDSYSKSIWVIQQTRMK